MKTFLLRRNHWRATLLISGLVVALAGVIGCSTGEPADDEPDEQVEQPVESEDDHESEHDGDHGDHEHHHDGEHDHDDHEHHHDHGDHHDHSFDDPEEYAERWNDPERDEWQRPGAVIDAMQIEEGMTVADLGAGTGYFVPHLAEAVGDDGEVVAIDIEESMLEFIEGKADEKNLDNVRTVLAEPDDTGLKADSVDRILTVNTWHHIPDREEYSAHLAGVLVEGGSVFNVDFDEDSPMGPPVEHRLDPDVVVDEMEAGGLDAEIIDIDLPRQYVVVGTVE